MLTNDPKNRFSRLSLLVGVAGVGVGIGVGFFVGIQPLLPFALLVVVAAVVFFFARLEQSVMGLLILRSSLDPFSAQQIPAAFAIGVDALTLLYVTVMLLIGRRVHTDGFWWFFASWVMLQGMWLIFSVVGGLGMDASLLSDGIREWIRRFSWLMVYLLVMQLKNRLHPEKVISLLFLSLVVPVMIGLVQLVSNPVERVASTLGHPNTFATYLSLFIALVWWKLSLSQRRWPWILLLILLAFVYVSTRSLTALATIGIIILFLNASKLNPVRIVFAVILFSAVVALFASTEAGQVRLNSLAETPLFNRDIDVSRAIISAAGDNNSFNWRIAHWHFLLQSWQEYPILGYGISTSPYLSPLRNADGSPYAPHNEYIRFLVEQGLVGLVLFLGFLGAQGVHLLRILRRAPPGGAERSLCLILLAIWLSMLMNMLANNVLDGTTFFFYWWTFLAVAGWGTEQFSHEAEAVQWE
jgi:O-antigen ligase